MRRSDLSINRTFLLHLVVSTVTATLALALVATAVILAPKVLRLEVGARTLEDMVRLTDDILRLHRTVWPVILVSLIAVTATSLFMYLRMTSPLVRFVHVFRRLCDGAIPGPIRLRTGDYLLREAEALNEMLEVLRMHSRDVHERHAELEEALADLSECALAQSDGALAERVGEVEARNKTLGETLRRLAAED